MINFKSFFHYFLFYRYSSNNKFLITSYVPQENESKSYIYESTIVKNYGCFVNLDKRHTSFERFVKPDLYVSPPFYFIFIKNAIITKYVYDVDLKSFVFDNWVTQMKFLVSPINYFLSFFRNKKIYNSTNCIYMLSYTNYYHFTIDQMVPIFCVYKNLIEDNPNFKIKLISSGKLSRSFQKEYLDLLFKDYNLIELDYSIRTHTNNVIFPSRIRDKFFYNVNTIKEFVKHIKNNLRLIDGSKKNYFISRGDAKTRKVLNEKELIGKLEKYGFEVICLTQFSIRQQIEIFHNAAIIISPHGAANTNIIFSENSSLIELFPTNEHRYGHYLNLSVVFGNNYYSSIAEKVEKDECFYVDINHLIEIINKINQIE